MTGVDLQWLRELVHKLRTQDSAGTADPIPTVQEEVRDYGVDEEYGGEFEWVHDDCEYSPVSETKAKRLERVYSESGEERDGYKRALFRKRWEHVQAFLTVDAAREYIRTQHYRHRGKLRLYIESGYRNTEMRKLREQLIAIDAKLNGGAA